MAAPLAASVERRPLLVVPPPRAELDEAEALAQLQASPVKRISPTELGRQWGWSKTKVTRRLKAWTEAGLLPPAPVRARRGRKADKRLETDTASVRPQPSVPDPPVEAALAELPADPVPRLATAVAPAPRKAWRLWLSRLPRLASGAVLIVAAVAIAWFGLRINAWYGQSLGRSAEASTLLAGLSISADVLALLLPAAARALWLDRHRAVALTAWLLWFVTIGCALLATIGFAAVNISDTTAARDKLAGEAGRLRVQIEQLRAERTGIGETRAVSAIEAELQRAQPAAAPVWKATAGCTDVTRPISGQMCAEVLRLREALGSAQRRDALDLDLRAAEARLAALPPVAAADPQAETAAGLLRWLTRGYLALAPEDIRMARVFGMTLLPQLAGLVFMLAFALCQPAMRRKPAPAAGGPEA